MTTRFHRLLNRVALYPRCIQAAAAPAGTDAAAAPAAALEALEHRLLLSAPPTVSDINAAPMFKNQTLAFAAATFSAAFSDPDPGDTLQSVQITAAPANGTLGLGSSTVLAGDVLPVGSLNGLTYTPNSGYGGVDTFRWNGSDGTEYAASDAAVNLNVQNNPPTVGDLSPTVRENHTLTFAATDFSGGGHFSDPDSGDTLQNVEITALPAHGALTRGGAAVATNDVIPYNQLDTFVYTPTLGYSGPDTFRWNGSDGTDYAASDAAVSISVTADQLPVLSDISRSPRQNQTQAFTAADFTSAFSDPDAGDTLQAIEITALPANGALTLNGDVVGLNEIISNGDLAGLLYTPTPGYSGADSFRWNATDGTAYAASDAAVTLTVAADQAPTVGAITKSVIGDRTVPFTVAEFTGAFSDPDAGDTLQSVKITTLPTHGTLKLGGVDVTLNQEIPTNQLTTLTYTRTAGYTGIDLIGWNGSDGTLYASTPALVHLAVVDEQVPTVTAITKSAAQNLPMIFTEANFSRAFHDNNLGDTLVSVKITARPLHGTLNLNGVPVTLGQEIPDSQLSTLTYTSTGAYLGADTFRWNGSDPTNYAVADAPVNIQVGVPQVVTSVTGNNTAITSGATTPSRATFTDFGYMGVVSGTATRTYTISNTGNIPLHLTGTPVVTLDGASAGDFTVTTLPGATVNPGETTTFVITFDPTAGGTRVARVVIATDDPAHATFTFAIQGTGVNTAVAVDGLQTLTTQTGTGGGAIAGGIATVNYTGYLTNGTVFDSSLNPGRTPFTVTLGQNSVIQGWEEGLLGMKLGETRILIIPPALGYGASPQGSIPANSTLIFEVQMVSLYTVQATGQGNFIPDQKTVGSANAPTTADDTSFGTLAPGQSATHTFTIAMGSGALTLPGQPQVQLTTADTSVFSVTQPVMAANGQSATFTVTYHPRAWGRFSAIVSVPTGDADHSVYQFTVQGGGTDLAGEYGTVIVRPTVSQGDTIVAQVLVGSVGWWPAQGRYTLSFVASPDTNFNNTSAFPLTSNLDNVPLPVNLFINGLTGVTAVIQVPTVAPAAAPAAGQLPAGTYNLLARITPVAGGPLTDTNPANDVISANRFGQAIGFTAVVKQPDLVVSLGAPLATHTPYVAGDWVTMPVTVTNQGTTTAEAWTTKVVQDPAHPTDHTKTVTVAVPTYITVEVRLAASSTYDASAPLVAQLTLPWTLARNASITRYVTFRLPSTAGTGRVYPVAQVDPINKIVKDQNNVPVATAEEASTTNNTAAAAALPVVWQFGAVPGRVGNTTLTITDANKTQVILQLVGPGMGQLTSSDGVSSANSIFDLTLTGTTAASRLVITTVKTTTAGDDGRFTLRNLTVGNAGDQAAIGAIVAPTTDLTGDVTINGPAASVALGNVSGQKTLSIGAPTANAAAYAVNLSLGQVSDLTLTSAIAIANLTVARWLDTNATADVITAPRLGALVAAGNFQAALSLSNANNAALTLGSATITGNVPGLTWDVTGKIGAVTILGTVGTAGIAAVPAIPGDPNATPPIAPVPAVPAVPPVPFQFSHTTDIGALSLGDVIDATLAPSGNVGSLTVQRWQAGSLNAKTLGVLNVTGKAAAGATPALPGDFQAALTITGPAAAAGGNVLGTATVAGAVGATTWDVTGKVGTVTIRGAVGTAPAAFQLVHATDVAALNLGDVTNATLTPSGNVGSLTAQRWLAGSLSAKTLGLLNVTGKAAVGAAAAIPGNLAADLTLTGPAVATGGLVLGSVSVANQITGGTWTITGPAGAVVAKSSSANWAATFNGANAIGNLTSLVLTDAAATSGLTLTANSVGVLQVLGNLASATVTLNQAPSAARPALSSLYVAKTMSQSTIRSAGNIGAVLAGVLDHSLIFAGVKDTVGTDNTVSRRPTAAADFVDPLIASRPTITSITLTGLTGAAHAADPVLIDSDIAAGGITLVNLPSRASAVSDPDTLVFGFTTRGGVRTYLGPVSAGNYVSGRDSVVS